jgi:hypothetical protein
MLELFICSRYEEKGNCSVCRKTILTQKIDYIYKTKIIKFSVFLDVCLSLGILKNIEFQKQIYFLKCCDL